MQPPSPLAGGNSAFIDHLYEQYLADPNAVSEDWQQFFAAMDADSQRPTRNHSEVQRQFRDYVNAPARAARASAPTTPAGDQQKQVSVLQLINAYRFRGHRAASLDPLKQVDPPAVEELDIGFHGLELGDLYTTFETGSLQGFGPLPLSEILDVLKKTYCGTIGAEYMHIVETGIKRWIQQQIEPVKGHPEFTQTHKLRILERLIGASALEEYLHRRYVGQKRFSLEGGESAIPLLDELIETAGQNDAQEIVIGMAHRGRLNVLVNIMGKHPSVLFGEFEGTHNNGSRLGDVKYHLGYSSDLEVAGRSMHLTLAFNPSHLEIINPVVEGSVRARQERRNDEAREQVVPVLIHGDSAFTGQGVVMETLNLSQTRGYGTGGTIHIVINNQIGFTTSEPWESRSTLYCTDVAKMVQAPIFHVNADDPEAVCFVARLAYEFRREFNQDVVIDLVCYRKHGHNESDEPAVTQPLMYEYVRSHPGVVKLYTEKLIREGVIQRGDADRITKDYIGALEHNQVVSRPVVTAPPEQAKYIIDFSPYLDQHWRAEVDTTLSAARIKHLSERLTSLPDTLALHRAVRKMTDARRSMGVGEQPFDWGFAETLAYASLLEDGHRVRLSGQDSGRGTFFHRHAVIHDQKTGATFIPLEQISRDQAEFTVINSTLSEEAVLGFEFGYAAAEPRGLVIWEAQFGDFVNGAQVVIDQFIASSEEKWRRLCGLVMFLPHGYDGQGPEHSSARLERFLQLCAEDNMQVAVPSTPAQMFHLIRRQVLRPYRKPLIVMTPKSLLRHKLSVSTLSEITDAGFQAVLPEPEQLDVDAVRRVVLCAGKVYFDLLEQRRLERRADVAIVRIEQLYPFPHQEIEAAVQRFPNVDEVVWTQEEPRNQGAWSFLLSTRHLGALFPDSIRLLCEARPYSASPAVGYMSLHLEQQRELVRRALDFKQGVDHPMRRRE